MARKCEQCEVFEFDDAAAICVHLRAAYRSRRLHAAAAASRRRKGAQLYAVSKRRGRGVWIARRLQRPLDMLSDAYNRDALQSRAQRDANR